MKKLILDYTIKKIMFLVLLLNLELLIFNIIYSVNSESIICKFIPPTKLYGGYFWFPKPYGGAWGKYGV